MSERVVVTGLGVVSSIGIGKDKFWDALIRGRSGISEISSFDTADFPTHRGGEIKNFHPEEFQKLGRASCLGLVASGLALQDAGLDLASLNREHAGVVMGTTMAETQVFEKLNAAWINQGVGAVDAARVSGVPAYNISLAIAKHFKLEGPNLVITTACAAGNYCIGYASDLIRKGEAEVMLAGGADAFSRIAFTGFNRLLAIAPEMCQPFDKNRKGMLLGEGSGVLVLESKEGALRRKAPIYAEVLGYGLSCDAAHMTAPDAAGIARAMEKCLQESGINPQDVDYINAHGTGTPANDRQECLAIKKVFGMVTKKIPVSSIKSMLGHTMGAASAIEAVTCCLSVKNDILPPTINFQAPDPECDIDCVPNNARSQKVEVVLNNSSAFGGNNACVALAKLT